MPPKPPPSSGVTSPSSPQPKTREQRQAEVLSHLIVETSDEEIKAVLRLYDPSLTEKQLQKALNKPRLAQLTATLNFLGLDKSEEDHKPEVIEKLVIRLQSLFPDECQICKSDYVVRRTDKPLIECARCTQGVYAQCLARKLGIAQNELEQMTPDEILLKLNPYSLQTLIYLCGACYESQYDNGPTPISNRQLIQTAKSNDAEDSDDGIRNHVNRSSSTQTPATANAQAQPPDHHASAAEDLYDADTDSDSEDNPPHSSSRRTKVEPNKTQTCSFYLKGQCKHGISGKGCSFSHPKLCQKLMTNGTNGKRGCSKGRDCDKTHPKMCTSSLKKRECLNDKCTSYHVKGTRRQNSKPLENRNHHNSDRRQTTTSNVNQQNSARSSSSDHQQSNCSSNSPQNFLEALDSWTTKFMSCLNQKLQNIQSPMNNQPAPMSQQQSLLMNQLLRQHQGAAAVNPLIPF